MRPQTPSVLRVASGPTAMALATVDSDPARRPAPPGQAARTVTGAAAGETAGSGPLDHCAGGGPACSRIQACMAIPLATPALIDRVEPYWAIEKS